MQTLSSVWSLVKRIEFQDWGFKVDSTFGGDIYLQVVFLAPDNDGGEFATWSQQKGRKWTISEHATDAEIVSTALKAVLTALEHEAREQFTFDGVAIFNPHIDLEALKSMATKTVFREERVAA